MGMEIRIFSLVIICMLSLQGQSQTEFEKKKWDSSRLLWTDFSGTPDPANLFHANSHTGITYSWSLKTRGSETKMDYEVAAIFVPENSWVREGKNSNHLLLHEQLHFDISEIHARKLRRMLHELDLGANQNLKTVLQGFYKKVETDRIEMQHRYDRETRHSQDKEAQENWVRLIEQELLKLEKYAS